MGVIELKHMTVRSGKFVLTEVSMTVPDRGYSVLMGRTGCGKTTLLEAVIGLRPVTHGAVILCGEDVTRLKPALRGIGYVPQDGALFQTMTVREHLAFPLTIRSESKAAIRARVDELSEHLEIAHLLHRYPAGLSGGEKQRVALGRALSFNPRVLLLDEPLSALDESTKETMYELLKRIQSDTGITALHITHSMLEAEQLADTMFLLRDGGIREVKPRQSR